MEDTCIACSDKAAFEMHGMAVCGTACATNVWNRVSNDVRQSIRENRFSGPMDLAPLEIRGLWQDLREGRDSAHRFEELVFDQSLLEDYDGYVRLTDDAKIFRLQRLPLYRGAMKFGNNTAFDRFVDAMMLQSHELYHQYAIDDETLKTKIREANVFEYRQPISDEEMVTLMHWIIAEDILFFAYMRAPALINGQAYALVDFNETDPLMYALAPAEFLTEYPYKALFRISLGHTRFTNFRMLMPHNEGRFVVDGQAYGPLSAYVERIHMTKPNLMMSWQLLRYKAAPDREPYNFTEETAFYELCWQVFVFIWLRQHNRTAFEPLVHGEETVNLTLREPDRPERGLAQLNRLHNAFVQEIIGNQVGNLATALVRRITVALSYSPPRFPFDLASDIGKTYVEEWMNDIGQRLLNQMRNPQDVEIESSDDESSDEESSDEESSSEESSSEDERRFEPHNAKRTRVVEQKMLQ